jgi:hypothetical protein
MTIMTNIMKSDDGAVCLIAAIAEEAWCVARQPRSDWSCEVELRPYAEVW